jgi:acyl-coenzyme A synthetase/AMP-(fatty) acid ligase
VVSLLAILAAGAAFTPQPAGADSDSLIHRLRSDRFEWPSHLSPLPTPAYVMPTSGSTGPVKHTVVTKQGLRGVFTSLHTRLSGHLPPMATWTQLHPLAFGFSVCEILGSLTFGGTLVIVEREEPLTFAGLSQRLSEESGPHVVCLTPSELSVLMSAKDAPLPSHIILSGEPAHRAPLRDLFARRGATPPVVVNTYAATETSGQITADLITAERLDAVLAGHVGPPLPDVEISLARPDGATVPKNDTVTEGEIQVRGTAVAAGYLDASAHAAKFAATGRERAFRTGDRGRWAPDGGLVVTGRAERRVKLSGHWTALDEIERALTEDGLAAEAAAVVEEYNVDGASGGRLLVAVVPRSSTRADAAARARRRVLRLLNGHATVRIVVCEAIPRTANGKSDARTLGDVQRTRSWEPGMAGTVMGVWTELLGAGFSADANLFESGVDSLGVIAASVRLTEELGRKVSPTFLIDHPRIRLQIEALSAQAAPAQPFARQGTARGSAAARRRAARRPADAPVPPAHTEGELQ